MSERAITAEERNELKSLQTTMVQAGIAANEAARAFKHADADAAGARDLHNGKVALLHVKYDVSDDEMIRPHDGSIVKKPKE
jgi:hypothetical protein